MVSVSLASNIEQSSVCTVDCENFLNMYSYCDRIVESSDEDEDKGHHSLPSRKKKKSRYVLVIDFWVDGHVAMLEVYFQFWYMECSDDVC